MPRSLLNPESTLAVSQHDGTDHHGNGTKHQLNINNENKPEKRHIAFLKVHKAASSTVQNILYRFGSQRNVSFVLPYNSHYISQHNSERYNPVLPSLDKQTGKFDILCNHVMFNQTKFKDLMYDDAVYLAIVRDPLDLFISAAYYYKYVWPAEYLKVLNETTFIQDLIRKPEELENLKHTRTFNYMAEDFGFVLHSVQVTLELNDNIIASFVSRLKDIFDFVMVVEYFDESLVMMKRLLNWSLKDIIYVKQNEFKSTKEQSSSKLNITDEDKVVFRRRNRIDYAIYDAFKEIFLKRKSEEKYLADEVKQFKTILSGVQTFCTEQMSSINETILPATEWNSAFSIDKHDCELMMRKELPFWKHLLGRHKLILEQTV